MKFSGVFLLLIRCHPRFSVRATLEAPRPQKECLQALPLGCGGRVTSAARP